MMKRLCERRVRSEVGWSVGKDVGNDVVVMW